jgi:hypothetical protein
LTAAVIGLAHTSGPCVYKLIAGLLQMASRSVSATRVQRIWLASRCCIRLRAEHNNRMWACSFAS